jgi:hypothetical protein
VVGGNERALCSPCLISVNDFLRGGGLCWWWVLVVGVGVLVVGVCVEVVLVCGVCFFVDVCFFEICFLVKISGNYTFLIHIPSNFFNGKS